jgi:hypothetical protein
MVNIHFPDPCCSATVRFDMCAAEISPELHPGSRLDVPDRLSKPLRNGNAPKRRRRFPLCFTINW